MSVFPSRPSFAIAEVEEEPEVSIGEVLSDTFEIRCLLGKGAMGFVFEAHDRLLNRRVAIKVPRASAVLHLRKEAQALAAIRHPSVVAVYGMGRHEGLEYVVMERLYGVTLASHLARLPPLPIADTVKLLAAIADGLVAVHGAGIAHGDIKPENIMLAPANRLVLTDFGLFLPETRFHDWKVSGSPAYMAPEAILNVVRPGDAHLIDLYSLGVLAFQVLTGVLPFEDVTTVETLKMHLVRPTPDVARLRPEVPAPLAGLVTDLLCKDPDGRPHRAEEVLARLRSLTGRPSEREMRAVAPSGPASKRPSRFPEK